MIRGIGSNRVLVIVDGMRVPDFPESSQGAGTYRREQTDLEDIKRVEIIFGPASALYGSDAIADRVAIIEDTRLTASGPTWQTLDPDRLSAVFATPIVRLEAAGATAFLSPGGNISTRT